MEYTRFGRLTQQDKTAALNVTLELDDEDANFEDELALLVQNAIKATRRYEDHRRIRIEALKKVRDHFNKITLQANGSTYTLKKVNNFNLGSNSYTAIFQNTDQSADKLFVKVPKSVKGAKAQPTLPVGTPCDVVATSIAAKRDTDPATGIQIMDMGEMDLFDAIAQGRLNDESNKEVMRWMFDSAACLLENRLVATDWKPENIAVMTFDPLTLRLIDVDSFYSLDNPTAGFFTTTPAGMSPIFPLRTTDAPSKTFKAQMVLTMAWTVVLNAVNVTLKKDTSIFQPVGKRTWTETTFFENAKAVAQESSFAQAVLEKFKPYLDAYTVYTKEGWSNENVEHWVSFVHNFFDITAESLKDESRSQKRVRVGAGFVDLCA